MSGWDAFDPLAKEIRERAEAGKPLPEGVWTSPEAYVEATGGKIEGCEAEMLVRYTRKGKKQYAVALLNRALRGWKRVQRNTTRGPVVVRVPCYTGDEADMTERLVRLADGRTTSGEGWKEHSRDGKVYWTKTVSGKPVVLEQEDARVAGVQGAIDKVVVVWKRDAQPVKSAGVGVGIGGGYSPPKSSFSSPPPPPPKPKPEGPKTIGEVLSEEAAKLMAKAKPVKKPRV